MSSRLRAGLYVTAGALAVVTVLVLVWRAEAGDSACGSALYDTVTAPPCGSPILLRRVLALVLGILAISSFGLASITGTAAARRVLRALAASLVVIAAAGALITANRLLQPTRSEYCGSVVNRHSTYDATIEARCNDLLTPYRNAAIVVGIIAAAALAGGVILWRRSARD